jgi:hypothetical protein
VAVNNRDSRLKLIEELITVERICSFERIARQVDCSDVTLRRDIATIEGISSFTHNGRFITLPTIPRFDENGIWFFNKVGFTRLRNSLDLIVNIVNSTQSGITKEALDEILKIDVYKQIHTLLHRHCIHRVKIGRKYHYIPESLAKNTQKRLRLLRVDEVEEYHDAKVTITDLIALLKAVLVEKTIGTDLKSIRRLAQKHSLSIPAKKIEQLLLKYDLPDKKKPSR